MFYWDPVSRLGFVMFSELLILTDLCSMSINCSSCLPCQFKTWHLVLLSVDRFIQFRASAKDYSDCWEICWLFSQLIDDYFDDSFYFSAIYQRITEKCLLPFIQFTIMQDKEKQKILTFERTEREILWPFCLKMSRIMNWLSKHWLFFVFN